MKTKINLFWKSIVALLCFVLVLAVLGCAKKTKPSTNASFVEEVTSIDLGDFSAYINEEVFDVITGKNDIAAECRMELGKINGETHVAVYDIICKDVAEAKRCINKLNDTLFKELKSEEEICDLLESMSYDSNMQAFDTVVHKYYIKAADFLK